MPLGRRSRPRDDESRWPGREASRRSFAFPVSGLERSCRKNREIYGTRSRSGPFERTPRQYPEVDVRAATHIHAGFLLARGLPRWLARSGHRLHGGSLCFPQGVSYTSLMELAFALFFGLVVGSFLNVCILRLPKGISISTPRSHCPQCKKLIPWYDNVPILSYVILRGKCRRCSKKISARYPLIEALSGLVSVLLYFKFGWSVEWAIYFAFSAAMIALAFIDLDHRILPDPITLNGIWLGVIASVYLAQPGFSGSLITRL